MNISGSVANLYNSQISSRGAALRQALTSAGNWLVGATLFFNRQVRYQVSSAPLARPAPSSFGAAIANKRATPRADLSRIRRLNNAQTAPFVQSIYAHLPAFLVPSSHFYPQDLNGVKLSRGDLQKLVGQGVTNFEGADFTGMNLDGMKLPGLNFTNAIFEYCSFKETDISNCNCKGALFGHTMWPRTNASGADFTDANMKGAYFRDPILDKANLTNVNFQSAVYRGESINGVILEAYSLGGIARAGAQVSGMKFQVPPGRLFPTIDRVPYQLDSSDFVGARISGTNFEERNLKESDFTDSELEKLNFEKSDLTRSKFNKARVDDTSFSEAVLRSSDFSEGRFLRVGFDKGTLLEANFENAKIVQTSFKEASAFRSDFSCANLQKVDFEEGVLNYAKFVDARIVETSFKGAYAARSNFSKASLREVDFRGATLNDANFEDAMLGDCDLRGTKFGLRANFTNTDFTGSLIDRKGLQSLIDAGAKTIHGVRLFGSIEGMDLKGVDLEYTLGGPEVFKDDAEVWHVFSDLLPYTARLCKDELGGPGSINPDEEFVARVICEEISRYNGLTPPRSLAELNQMGKVNYGQFDGWLDLSQRVFARVYRLGVSPSRSVNWNI